MGVTIEPCRSVETAGWLALRLALWPHHGQDEHATEMASFLAEPSRFAQYMAYKDSRLPVAFVEIALRHDYVNGTSTSPVAFLEGIYVVPSSRRQGIARSLVNVAESWARGQGCSEFASDASIDNVASHKMHRALGFEESERVVYFRKSLSPR